MNLQILGLSSLGVNRHFVLSKTGLLPVALVAINIVFDTEHVTTEMRKRAYMILEPSLPVSHHSIIGDPLT